MWNGTSGSAPIVAGIAALVMQAHPDLDTTNIINRILVTADPVGKVGNVRYGWGIVDAYEAVTADVPLVDSNPLGTIAEWVPLHRFTEWTTKDLSLPQPEPIAVAEPVVSDGDNAAAAIDNVWASLIAPLFALGGLLASFAVGIYGFVRRVLLARTDPLAR